jgi:uncharacterized membrane protein
MARMIGGGVAAMLALAAIATPVAAKDKSRNAQPMRYEYDGRFYDSLEECRASKKKAKKDGAIAGAAAAGVGAAILGANLGEAALIAGGGALVGKQIGKSKKC